MTFPSILFAILAGVLLYQLPRHWATLALLFGATYTTVEQSLEIGPFHFTVIRLLVVVGVLRVLARKEHLEGGLNKLDKLMIAWAAWAVLSSFFHKELVSTLVFRLGMAYDGLGFYFLLRIFIQDTKSIWGLCEVIVILLIPVCIEMVTESITGTNYFSIFGNREISEVRGGKVRAQGPFLNSILAGSVGAVCFPMAALLWNRKRLLAILGVIATVGIVLSSRSSGPILTTIFISCGFALWPIRNYMRFVRRGAVVLLLVLNSVMSVPVYYLLGRIDLTGSSTGWHRAELIGSTIAHFSEWWLGGTDYTRHWMPTGVPWSDDHTDITNHYIKMGVYGGILLMILFVWIVTEAFSMVGKGLKENEDAPFEDRFLLWALGAILFGHAATMMSVSYFDQSILFLYLVLAAIGSIRAATVVEEVSEEGDEPIPSDDDERNLCHNS